MAGWLAVAMTNVIAEPVGSVLVELVGTEEANTIFLSTSVVWMVLAIFQAATLAIVALPSERRRLLPLAALWVLAGTVGGALGVGAIITLAARVLPDAGGDLFLGIAVSAAGSAVSGALYGAATGVVLAVLARRFGGREMHPQGRGQALGILRTVAGLGLVLALGFGVASCYTVTLQISCDDEREILEEFPHYGGREIEPEPSPVSSDCIVRFFDSDPEEEIFAYYSERLRENGWEVESEPPPYSEITEPTGPEQTAPAGKHISSLRARRDGYGYVVTYNPQRRSEEARVVVSVSEVQEPPQ